MAIRCFYVNKYFLGGDLTDKFTQVAINLFFYLSHPFLEI